MNPELLKKLEEYKKAIEALEYFKVQGTIDMEYLARAKDKLTKEINDLLEVELGLLKPEEKEKVEEIAQKAEEEKVEEEKTEETPQA